MDPKALTRPCGTGHDALLAALKELIERKCLPQVILFHGRGGIGKKQIAKEVTWKALLANQTTQQPESSVSSLFTMDTHPDLWVVPDHEDLYVSEISHQIKNHLAIHPSRSAYRVALIPHADRFHPRSASLLLKTLEEPPPYALVLMTTSRPHSMLATLKSRAVLCHVKAPSFDNFAAALTSRWAAKPSQESLSSTWVKELYTISAGSVGEAMYMLESKEMLMGLQEILGAAYPVWLLPSKAEAFLKSHTLSTNQLLFAIEFCLRRIYQKQKSQHQRCLQPAAAAVRRKLLSQYHRVTKEGAQTLQTQMLLQACVSASYLNSQI